MLGPFSRYTAAAATQTTTDLKQSYLFRDLIKFKFHNIYVSDLTSLEVLYYLASIQASTLAYKDDVIYLTLLLNINLNVANALPVIKQRKCFT